MFYALCGFKVGTAIFSYKLHDLLEFIFYIHIATRWGAQLLWGCSVEVNPCILLQAAFVISLVSCYLHSVNIFAVVMTVLNCWKLIF